MARTHAGDGRGHLAAMHVVLHRCAHCTRDVVDELALRHGVALLADSTGPVHFWQVEGAAILELYKCEDTFLALDDDCRWCLIDKAHQCRQTASKSQVLNSYRALLCPLVRICRKQARAAA